MRLSWWSSSTWLPEHRTDKQDQINIMWCDVTALIQNQPHQRVSQTSVVKQLFLLSWILMSAWTGPSELNICRHHPCRLGGGAEPGDP